MTGKASLWFLGKPLYTIPPKYALLKLLTHSNQSETKYVIYRKKKNHKKKLEEQYSEKSMGERNNLTTLKSLVNDLVLP